MIKPLFLSICFILLNLISHAQFNGWGVYDSTNSPLPSSLVTSVSVGANNKVWIGTNMGLASFEDLIDWKVYTTSNSNIASNWISRVKVAPNNTAWYTTQSGSVGYFNNNTFTNFTAANSPLGAFPVTDLAFDGNIVWFTTQGAGVFKYDNGIWTQYSESSLGLPLDAAQCIHVDEDGIKYIGTYNEGVFIFDNTNWTRVYNLNANMPLNNIATIYKEDANLVWLGIGVQRNDSSLLKYNFTSVQILDESMMNGIQTSNIRHVNVDHNGVKWIASNDDDKGGLIRYNDTTYSVFRQFSSGLPSNRVYETAMDDSSNLWIATFKGLAAYNEANAYLSTESELSPMWISAWPNPARDILNFELAETADFSYRVFNVIGVEVLAQKQTQSNKALVDVSHLSQGVYFVSISQSNSSYLLRFIKQ